MLQSALSSGDKADSLYAYCEDRDIRLDCRRTGFRDDDLMAARLKQEGFQWVRAVGTTGKRSLMLALVVALAIEKEDLLDELWALLRSYHIHTHFAEVLHCSKEALSMVNFSRQSPAPKDTMNSLSRGLRPALADCAAAADPEVPEDSHGVDLQFVGNGVPVLGLDKTSVFQGCASWLLQTATGSDGKADGLFEYFNARELVSACCSLGLTKDDVFLARLKRAGLQEVQAVGTTGKRSVMLALVVALVLQERVQAESMMKTVRGFDRALEEPFLSLVRRALRHGSAPAGRPPAKRPKCVIEDSPGPEELRARGQRAQRFEAAAAAAAAGLGGEVQKAASMEEKPIQGSCTQLERPYVRITGLLKPSDVRPLPVLRQSFALVQRKWAEKHDWVYASEMLRSIRQDLTVQLVRDAFTVEVYEFCARTALEVGDFKQFDQCSTQLEELYADAEAGVRANMPEFIAYRLLYLTLQDEHLALAAFVKRHSSQLCAGAASSNANLALAWALRAALAQGNFARASRLAVQARAAAGGISSASGVAGAATERLSATLLHAAALQRLLAICRAYKPCATRKLLQRVFKGGAVGKGDGQLPADLPVVFKPGSPDCLDGPATAAEAERLLPAPGARARRRLGEQSSEHMRGFVRTLAGC